MNHQYVCIVVKKTTSKQKEKTIHLKDNYNSFLPKKKNYNSSGRKKEIAKYINVLINRSTTVKVKEKINNLLLSLAVIYFLL